MVDLVFLSCVVVFLLTVVQTAVAATRWCGPVWFQRSGSSMAILALAVSLTSSQAGESTVVHLVKPLLDNVSALFALVGAVIGGFGEVIWTLIHRGDRRIGDVMRSFVNS